MKLLQTTSMLLISSAVAVVPLSHENAYASSTKPQSAVQAELNGKPCLAISVGTDTYLDWSALEVFHTPNEYLGNGQFAVTGGTVQGLVYKGHTYLPWSNVAPKVKATKLKTGGFNFTSVAIHHAYHIEFQAADVPVGSPAPLLVAVFDGNQSVPHQKVDIQVTGTSYFSSDSNGTESNDFTDSNGTGLYGVNDTTAEQIHPTITWKDPSGQLQTATANITFKPASTTGTPVPVPADDAVLATVPITTFENAVLFNAQAGGVDTLFQLDTGAFATLLTKEVADAFHLPNLGSVPVQGVTGQDQGYISKITLTIGGVQFDNIPCIVDPNYTGTPLLGYEFFSDTGYDLLVSQKHSTMTILK